VHTKNTGRDSSLSDYGNIQISLVRDGAAFSYSGIEYGIVKMCDDKVHAVAYYPHDKQGERLLLDRATVNQAISLSINFSDSELN
jgi:hypothetical protein